MQGKKNPLLFRDNGWKDDTNKFALTLFKMLRNKINHSDTSAPKDIYGLIAPNVHNVAYTGQENVLDKPCFVFSYSLTINTSGISLSGTGKAWIGISDSFPHQVDLNARSMGRR